MQKEIYDPMLSGKTSKESINSQNK